ncbi:MAG: hypothetical protein RSG22_14960 [Comamonas sp.]
MEVHNPVARAATILRQHGHETEAVNLEQFALNVAAPAIEIDLPAAGSEALAEYLAHCDRHAITPDVGGAFAWAVREVASHVANLNCRKSSLQQT